MSEQGEAAALIRLDCAHTPALRPGEIHLYVVPINEMPDDELALQAKLNKDELERADRFINPEHGRNFRRIRGLLRDLIGRYLQVAPADIEFVYAEHGKPSIKDETDLHFNLSHSQEMAVFAFSLRRELGVDIEHMRVKMDLPGLIRHVASIGEQTELKGLPEFDQQEAFYRLWTRKEAFIKAVGRGLGMGLRSIHIGTAPSTVPMSVTYKNKPVVQWYITDVDAPPNYKLAVCAAYQ